MIKTKQITKGAMVCAIYGALLFLNQQSALMIESSASWIFFAFPVLIYTAMNGVKMGVLVTVCMGLMTMFFGGFTTWFYSWTSLLIGFLYGVGVSKHVKNMTNFIFCFILSVLANLCIILLWSKLFGIDFYEDFRLISQYIPFISLKSIYIFDDRNVRTFASFMYSLSRIDGMHAYAYGYCSITTII